MMQGAEQYSSDKESRTINIGIDLGTSSTKVIYQVIELAPGKNAFVFDFGFKSDDFPLMTLPSIVAMDSGRLYFGDEAYRRKDSAEAVFNSFKMCLACFRRITSCKNCRSIGLSDFKKGFYDNSQYHINACDATIFYLAYVMRIVTDHLKSRYNPRFQIDFYYNICFPLNFLDQSKSFFEWTINYAREIKNYIEQGMRLKKAYDVLEQTYGQSPNLPGKESKKVFLIEETRAAMHSIVKSGYLESGLYSVVDVGASTSDLSFFRYSDMDTTENPLSFYANHSCLLGGNDFDIAIYKHICSADMNGKPNSELMYDIRAAKEQLQNQERFNIPQLNIDWDVRKLLTICRDVLNALHSQYSKILREDAFEKEPILHTWNCLKILLIGGGSQWPFLKGLLGKSPFLDRRDDWQPTFPEITIPDNLNLADQPMQAYEFKKNFIYFYVAHGLSYFYLDIIKSVYPENVPPFIPPEIRVEQPDRDELYPP